MHCMATFAIPPPALPHPPLSLSSHRELSVPTHVKLPQNASKDVSAKCSKASPATILQKDSHVQESLMKCPDIITFYQRRPSYTHQDHPSPKPNHPSPRPDHPKRAKMKSTYMIPHHPVDLVAKDNVTRLF